MSNKLEYFSGELVSVYTDIIVDAGHDEEGNPLSGRQAYVGWLLDHDDTWVILGEISDDHEPSANAAIKVSQIVHIELKLDSDEQEVLSRNAISDNLN